MNTQPSSDPGTPRFPLDFATDLRWMQQAPSVQRNTRTGTNGFGSCIGLSESVLYNFFRTLVTLTRSHLHPFQVGTDF